MPNRNSYLSVSLSPETRCACAQLQQALDEAVVGDGHKFSPLSLDDLHLTFNFCGEELSKLPAETLKAWHLSICDEIKDLSEDLSRCTMRFSQLDVFPPGKNNLVVARFDAPEALHQLQWRTIRALQAAAAKYGHGRADLADLRNKERDSWAPHVTLGKVHAPKGVVANVAHGAARKAASSADTVTAFSMLREVPAAGLSLCGAQPKHVWIDWRGTLGFASVAASDERMGLDIE